MTIAYITVERFTALEERLAAIESQPGTPALVGEIDRLTDRLDECERNVAWLRAADRHADPASYPNTAAELGDTAPRQAPNAKDQGAGNGP